VTTTGDHGDIDWVITVTTTCHSLSFVDLCNAYNRAPYSCFRTEISIIWKIFERDVKF